MRSGLAVVGILFAVIQEPAKQPEVVPEAPLREPGFLFLEINVRDIPQYIRVLHDVGGYQPVRIEKNFAILQTTRGEILLTDTSGPKYQPPADGKLPQLNKGGGVEIGLVVADLDKAFAAAEQSGWKIGSKIENRPWGVRDFRIYAPDGYYLRFTE